MLQLALWLALGLDGGTAGVLEQYKAAREAQPDGAQVVECEKLELSRPGAKLKLESGRLAFLPKVAGRAWGAVFVGQGSFRFAAASESERGQTRRFAKRQEEVEERFTELVLYFSDATMEEIGRQGKIKEGSVEGLQNTLKWAHDVFRERLRSNQEASVMRYLFRGEGAYFLALMKGKQWGTLVYEFAPADREEVSLLRVKDKDTVETWNSFGVAELGGAAAGLGKETVDCKEVKVETVLTGSGHLEGTAEVEFTALTGRERLVRMMLASPLRVSSVQDGGGRALEFIQESEKKDGALWVVAPEAFEKGKTYRWRFSYAGKDVVSKAGDGNFFVGARSSWFPRPAVAGEEFGDRARFRMTFRVPKEFTLVATGKEVSRKTEGKQEVSEWDSERAVTVAGFNFGRFTTKSMEANGFAVSVFTNNGLADDLKSLRTLLEMNPKAAQELGISPSALTTSGMSERAAVEALNALTFFSRAFGELPEKQLRVSQQPSGYFGQSWPGLLFMPYTSFLDETARHQLKMDQGGMRRFLEEVGPHEVAHQWWGHAVVWRDYRDQWLSEGFAEYSAALYQQAMKGKKAFLNTMKSERDSILIAVGTKQPANEAGPVNLGYRLSGEDFPNGGELIYAKGAYVLHMLRMLMHDYARSSDSKFIAMMKDFVKEFSERPASTEDFERHVSKHMGKDMKFFFDQWVRASAVPKLTGSYSARAAEGKTQLVFDVRVSGVPIDFEVVLPVALKFKNGTTTGRLQLRAPGEPVKVEVPEAPESVEFNPNLELLGEVDIKKK